MGTRETDDPFVRRRVAPPRCLLAAVGAGGRPLPCFVSCDPLAALVVPAESEDFARSPALPQGIEAALGPGASASAEVLEAGRVVVRCQCREDPLMAELGRRWAATKQSGPASGTIRLTQTDPQRSPGTEQTSRFNLRTTSQVSLTRRGTSATPSEANPSDPLLAISPGLAAAAALPPPRPVSEKLTLRDLKDAKLLIHLYGALFASASFARWAPTFCFGTRQHMRTQIETFFSQASLRPVWPLSLRTARRLTLGLAAITLSMLAPIASAAITLNLVSVTQTSSLPTPIWTWTYRASSTSGGCAGGNYFTIYDLPGDVKSVVAPTYFGDPQIQLSGLTPSGLTPTDDLTLKNVSFVFDDPSTRPCENAFVNNSETFAILLSSGAVKYSDYSWETYSSYPIGTSPKISGLGVVGGGDNGGGTVPEPQILALISLGLAGLAIGRSRSKRLTL